ncbi:alpha/beta fold hydrolase [Candidatus Microgenomates bacterium]|nr:alpha/beta fold hydrolase [Candidatus Microgenomates bacterium]
MGKAFFIIGILFLTVGASLWFWQKQPTPIISPAVPKPTPLAKYSFEQLRTRSYEGSEIKLERVLEREDEFTSYVFSFTTDSKRVTGQANLPAQAGLPLRQRLGQAKSPVVVMLRGYADKEIYFTGLGTRKAAGEFAKAGFITLAPDFLGFGGSDSESADIIEARLEKPVTILNLLESIKTLPQADIGNVFLWGHSNGGQVALSVLEVGKNSIPTTLWAPVTRPFPQNVLDYIGELDDQGRMVMASISAFLANYNPAQFSVETYVQDITVPLQVHQGTGDQLVKVEWTNEFVEKIRSLEKQVDYYTYKGDDHNLSRNWDTVVARDIEFFKKHLQ